MRIAGIDPSLTNTGIAVLDCTHDVWEGQQLQSQPIALHSIGWGDPNAKTYLQRNRRTRAVAGEVMQYVLDRRPDVIAIEAPIPRMVKGGSQFDRWFLFELMLAECDIRQIPAIVVNPRTRQKWPTGNGNASKAEIHEAVRQWWEYPHRIKVKNEDIADAAVLALMVALRLDYAMPFPVKDRHWNVVDTVAWPAGWAAPTGRATQLLLS